MLKKYNYGIFLISEYKNNKYLTPLLNEWFTSRKYYFPKEYQNGYLAMLVEDCQKYISSYDIVQVVYK